MRTMFLALAIVLGTATTAHAQFISRAADRFHTPQNWALELRLGPYYPDVDSEFAGTSAAPGPHHLYFGDSRRLMTQFEIDWQFFHAFGTAAIGATAGYFRETARAFVEPAAGDPLTDRSGDETHLSLMPLVVSFVYRADQLARRWSVPLVPYGKIGLCYTLWSISNANGDVATTSAAGVSAAGRGRGGTTGWYGAVGAAFLLDVLDPGSARELDADVGVNHTYFFLEAARFEMSSFGKKGVLHVGDTTWLTGLLFEF